MKPQAESSKNAHNIKEVDSILRVCKPPVGEGKTHLPREGGISAFNTEKRKKL